MAIYSRLSELHLAHRLPKPARQGSLLHAQIALAVLSASLAPPEKGRQSLKISRFDVPVSREACASLRTRVSRASPRLPANSKQREKILVVVHEKQIHTHTKSINFKQSINSTSLPYIFLCSLSCLRDF